MAQRVPQCTARADRQVRNSLRRITLRQLQVFRAVCSNRSYSRAAEDMALSQPAVSLQMRQLEELIGQPLFEYMGRQLYLTDAAEALSQASKDIFDRLEMLDMQLSDLQGCLQGQLTLAVESSAKYFVPHLFAAFQKTHQEVGLQLVVANRRQIIRRLTDNRDDLVIMSLLPSELELDFWPFMENPVVAVAPPEHPLCQAGKYAPLTLKDLTPYPLLVREPGSGTRQATDEYLRQKRAHFQQILEINSLDALREGVIAGLGLALLPRHAVTLELAHGLLQELPVTELPLYRSWCILHPRGKRLSPVAQAFLAFVRQERQQINALAARFSETAKHRLATE